MIKNMKQILEKKSQSTEKIDVEEDSMLYPKKYDRVTLRIDTRPLSPHHKFRFKVIIWEF